jgi:hypothetical protein
MRREENERYEKELNEHMETRSKLMQLEGKYKHIQTELRDAETRYGDAKRLCAEYEAENGALRAKIYEADSSCSMQVTETKEA